MGGEELRDVGGVLGGLFPFVRAFYGSYTPLFFSTSRVDFEDGEGGRVVDDDGGDGLGLGLGLGLDGDDQRLDGCGRLGDEAVGCEKMVVELESATGTRQGDPLGGHCLR